MPVHHPRARVGLAHAEADEHVPGGLLPGRVRPHPVDLGRGGLRRRHPAAHLVRELPAGDARAPARGEVRGLQPPRRPAGLDQAAQERAALRGGACRRTRRVHHAPGDRRGADPFSEGDPRGERAAELSGARRRGAAPLPGSDRSPPDRRDGVRSPRPLRTPRPATDCSTSRVVRGWRSGAPPSRGAWGRSSRRRSRASARAPGPGAPARTARCSPRC